MLESLLLFAIVAESQTASTGTRPPPTPASTALAARATQPPTIDGRDDDDAWRTAQAITEFLEFEPNEGKPARFATEAKVAYDQRNFYVFIRAFDPEPSRIVKHLARRDVRPPTDQLKIIVDSYHDRRSGYEFAVNPAGVKRDYAIYNDGEEDDAWDGVWDVGTTVDSLGWTAEFRIPLSQLRYANVTSHTFGFAVWRDIERFKERVSWPLYRRSQSGLSSQLGDVTGITGISSPRRLEMTPYAVTKNVSVPTATGFDREQRITGGIDFKYGVTSNLTLDGTVNPDFGQVEADPAVLNLGAFETFFQEKRPFFIEGIGLLRFPVNCNVVRDCGSENLFYSRRIGRDPQLRRPYGNASSPTATTILGAAKLTGRLPSGLSLGLLDAVTKRQAGGADRTIEPATNFTLIRATQDFRNGETGLGVIATAVNRSLDQWTRDFLRSSALVGGADVRHRFQQGRYQVSGSLTASRVAGSPAAIAATQRSSIHNFQRPDALRFDSTRTALAGHAGQIKFGKFGGDRLYFETSLQRVSAGYEINDLGFLRRADWQQQASWAQLHWNKPTAVFQRLSWNFNEWNEWTTAGLPLEHAVNTNVHTELKNHWWLHAGGTLGQLGTTFCDIRCARGGPAIRVDPYLAPWGGIEGDGRKVVVPFLWMNYWRTDEGRTKSFNVNPSVNLRMSSRWKTSVGVSVTNNRENTQFVREFPCTPGCVIPDSVTLFAHLKQREMSFQWRLDFTASPNLTLQIYAEPFVSKGEYSNVREIADARAEHYADRFTPYGDTAITNNPGGFNFKQFRSNTVLRWEYKPGSTIFLVWTQGRGDLDAAQGVRSFGGDFQDLFRQHPDNTFLIKVSHWFDW